MNIMSKKNVIIWFIILSYSINKGVYAQYVSAVCPFNTQKKVVIDTVKLQVSYELRFLPDTTKKNVLLTNRLTLSVGNTYTKLMSSEYDELDKLEAEAKVPKGSAIGVKGQGLAATVIYKNRKTNQMEVNVNLNTIYRYIEGIPKQVWKVLNERKQILGYPCQAATTTYLGRTYTAWFAPTIPIPEGPWKLSGLPGLILEVSDSRGHYVFKCVGLERPKQLKLLEKYKLKYVDINRKKLNIYIKKLHEHFAVILESQGCDLVYFTSDGKEIDNKKLVFPYNPIELE